MVLDVIDGWVVYTLAGPDARDAFGRCPSSSSRPPGSCRGRWPGSAFGCWWSASGIDLLVPSMLAAHCRSGSRTSARELLT